MHNYDASSSLDSSGSEGPPFPGVPESTKEFIRQLLHEKDEARENYSQETIRSQCLATELETAQSDRVVVRAQLTAADSRVACKLFFPEALPFPFLNFFISDSFASVLESQV